MKNIISMILINLLIPALAMAHGIGEHGADEAHHHIGIEEVAIGLGVIGAIALAWALLTGKKQ